MARRLMRSSIDLQRVERDAPEETANAGGTARGSRDSGSGAPPVEFTEPEDDKGSSGDRTAKTDEDGTGSEYLSVLQDSFPAEVVALWLAAVAILQAPDTPDSYYVGVFVVTFAMVGPLFLWTTRKERSGLVGRDKIKARVVIGTQIAVGMVSFLIWAYATAQPFRERIVDPLLAPGAGNQVPTALAGLLILFWGTLLPVVTFYSPKLLLFGVKRTKSWENSAKRSPPP